MVIRFSDVILTLIQLLAVHKERKRAIAHCVDANAAAVKNLREKIDTLPESNPEAASIKKKLGMHLRKVKYLIIIAITGVIKSVEQPLVLLCLGIVV